MSNNWIYGAALVIIVVIVGVYLLTQSNSAVTGTQATTSQPNSGYTTAASGATSSSYPVMITDPATVPPGTSALVITYSDVMLHEAGTNNYVNATIAGSASGTVNLLNLSGNTKTIASAQNTNGSTFDSATFLITSALITINGTAYSVPVVNGQVTANITGSANANGGAIVQLSPTVVQVYNGSSNFAMVTSAKAAAVSSQTVNTSGSATVGVTTALNSAESAALNTGAAISVTGVTAAASGNATVLNATVTNTGSGSVTVTSVVLNGYARQAQASDINSTAGLAANVSLSTGLLGIGASANAQLVAEQAANFQSNYYNQLNFVVASNGSLEMPATYAQISSAGYVLAPGQSATFSFNGAANLGYNNTVAVLIPNQNYTTTVVGNAGVTSATTATAQSD